MMQNENEELSKRLEDTAQKADTTNRELEEEQAKSYQLERKVHDTEQLLEQQESAYRHEGQELKQEI